MLKVAKPIFGFEDINEFEFEKIDDFFYTIKSDEISFTLIDPLAVRDYSFNIDNSYKEMLEAKDFKDIKVYNIVTILNPIEESTINFLAPILINEKKSLLTQIVLDEKKYPEFGLREKIKNFL